MEARGSQLTNKYAYFVTTTTTHKTLRGPRGRAILCKEALEPEFAKYQKQVLKNAKKLEEALISNGFDLVSGGTDNHLLLIDLRNKNLTGKEVEKMLDEIGITTNKNTIPFDPKSPFVTSGIRIGTPAVTTRGMKEPEMEEIAEIMALIVNDSEKKEEAKNRVKELCAKFKLY